MMTFIQEIAKGSTITMHFTGAFHQKGGPTSLQIQDTNAAASRRLTTSVNRCSSVRACINATNQLKARRRICCLISHCSMFWQAKSEPWSESRVKIRYFLKHLVLLRMMWVMCRLPGYEVPDIASCHQSLGGDWLIMICHLSFPRVTSSDFPTPRLIKMLNKICP